jgi:hypothetical protein
MNGKYIRDLTVEELEMIFAEATRAAAEEADRHGLPRAGTPPIPRPASNSEAK